MWSMTLPYHCLSVLGLAILFQTWFSTFFVTEASGIFIYGSLSLTSHHHTFLIPLASLPCFQTSWVKLEHKLT